MLRDLRSPINIIGRVARVESPRPDPFLSYSGNRTLIIVILDSKWQCRQTNIFFIKETRSSS